MGRLCEVATMPAIWLRVFSRSGSLNVASQKCETESQNAKIGWNVIEIVVNGESRQVASAMSISSLLEHLDLDSRAIAVEINSQLQPRDTHQRIEVKAGDVLEIVSLVGGG